jgi:hypothetical protein
MDHPAEEMQICNQDIILADADNNTKNVASPLDWFLVLKESEIKPSFHSFLDGSEVTKENQKQFVDKVKENIASKQYPTTDHLFIRTKINGVNFLCVSLDNSARANENKSPLIDRLDAILKVVKKCILFDDVICFSEACRGSFNANGKQIPWFLIRDRICRKLGVIFLGESTNNDNPNGMSFGIAAFATSSAYLLISQVIPTRILREGYGSGCLGIKCGDTLIWFIHFPLDFKNQGKENLGAITMRNLISLMKETNSTIAIGDFNTISGNVMSSISEEIPEDFEMRNGGFQTYYGAWFDRIPNREGDKIIGDSIDRIPEVADKKGVRICPIDEPDNNPIHI